MHNNLRIFVILTFENYKKGKYLDKSYVKTLIDMPPHPRKVFHNGYPGSTFQQNILKDVL